MGELSRKQREIRKRGERIFQVAFELFDEGGLDAVRMDTVAARLDCTRTTLYNHFENREAMLVAMAEICVGKRLAMFRHAVSCADGSRDRILGICIASMVYAELCPSEFLLEQCIRSQAIWQQTKMQRREIFTENEVQSMRLAGGCVQTGITRGDLPLPAGLTVQQMVERVCFGLWSIAVGGLSIAADCPDLNRVGIRDFLSTIHQNCNTLLDGFAWKPKYEPLEYQRLLDRLTQELESVAKSWRLEITSLRDDTEGNIIADVT